MELSRVIILGGSGEIGLSLIDKYLENEGVEQIYATYCRNHPQLQNKKIKWFKLDVTKDEEINDFFASVKEDTSHIDVFISTIGAISFNGVGPEKSLKDVSTHQLTRAFKVNAFYAPIVSNHLRSLLSKSTSSYVVFLSALVGSIQENYLGGWYSYRASKAALNMFVKTIAIEFKRLGLKSTVLSIHPGTTDTKLSRPYSSNVKHQIWTSLQTAQHVLDVMSEATIEDTGSFYHWDKSKISW